jgi:hypothetical protein
MAQNTPQTADSRHAKTDLYDTVRRTFYIQYPVWFITLLALAGVAAVGVTGFLGYTKASPIHAPIDDAFSQPWLLYLWMSALLITLIASILRDASLRGRLIAMLAAAAVAIVFIGVTKFNGILPDFIQRLLGQHVLLNLLAGQPATYNIVNFGVLAIFWVDTVRRWIRHARGLPLDPRADIGIGEDGAPRDPSSVPTMSELVSGDFMAGAVLALLLAGVFHRDILGQFIRPEGGLTWCHVSWLAGTCGQGATLADPPTLSFLDVLQTLLYLVIALTILALTAMVSGLGAVGGVDDQDLALAATATADESSTMPIALDVTQTLLKTIKAAIDRRLRLLAHDFLLSVRLVGWPALLFIGTYGIADLCTNIQLYLHSPKMLNDVLVFMVPAAGWGALAIACAVGSVALMVFRLRVVTNTSLFLGLIGFILLLTFWIFSFTLWVVNLLINKLTDSDARYPFPPSWLTYISLAALILVGLRLLMRMMSGQRVRPAAARAEAASQGAGEPVGAAITSGSPSAPQR